MSSRVIIGIDVGGSTTKIGGFDLINYGSEVDVSDLPVSELDEAYSKDASWRKEALERIEEVRKGVMLCPHGRPITLIIKKHEFEKMFKRIV